MNIVRWDPFKTVLSWNEHAPFRFEGAERSWVPAVDIIENNDKLSLRVELPGVERGDIDVRVEDGVLTVQGERKRSDEVEQGKVYRSERFYGSFTRRFSLPDGFDAAAVSATYRDGVLEITLPKAESAKPRKIEIEAA